jgi:hypothetical protein
MKLKTALLLSITVCLQSCLHTAKVTQKFTTGSSLSPSDVVLFTGYNGKKSRTSKSMFEDTERILSRCGIKVINIHDPGLNLEFFKAGLTPAEPDVNNDDFINKMKEAYGITHLFSVNNVAQYNGNAMNIDNQDIHYGGAGLVFEVYDLGIEKTIASMKVKGKTWHVVHDGLAESSFGNKHKNYTKGLKTLMKSSSCR